MQAQMENIHIGPFPYLADFGDSQAQGWEDATAEVAASRHYAIMTGTYEFMPAVGFAAAFEPSGNMIAHIKASLLFEKHPMVYDSVNTTNVNTSQIYDIDGQMAKCRGASCSRLWVGIWTTFLEWRAHWSVPHK
ncbi:aliphatic nitrilase [Penicillium antarcticum]|uniref:aliphatic nitrilase n=1 Tax=Penicillium antarcticum TaxID=416450 RepID=UPI002398B37E|nr:aliphatic nitrilase [Penicillium antarcticum]KAJ5316624.1 aliphatic nitrilase [Penicillium antarcticum]